jgi:hypothetical protein
MAEGIEVPQSGAEQEPKDPRIDRVIDELSESSRFLRDPRLLETDLVPESMLDSESIYPYESDDGLRYVIIYKSDLLREDYSARNLPRELQEHERIIPMSIESSTVPNSIPAQRNKEIVWFVLDKENPTIYQLIKNNGEAVVGEDIIRGDERVIERPELLPTILDIVRPR